MELPSAANAPRCQFFVIVSGTIYDVQVSVQIEMIRG